jgi:nucleoside-diphosphate kinase
MPAAAPERTLVLIKTDGVARRLTGEILSRFERAGLRIAALKMVRPDRDLIERHYPSDEGWLSAVGRAAREGLEKRGLPVRELLGTDDPVGIGRQVKRWNADYLTAGPVVAVVLEGLNAVAAVRKLTGKTLPSLAEPGTIRGDYSTDDSVASAVEARSVRNLIHASGAVAEAEYEIGLWFAPAELQAPAPAEYAR